MKPSLLSRSVHKWLALFVGLQLLVWAVTGFYMVAIDLDFIHGDSLVRNLRTPVGSTRAVLPVAQLTSRYPEITLLSLHSLPVLSEPVYELTAAGRRVLLPLVRRFGDGFFQRFGDLGCDDVGRCAGINGSYGNDGGVGYGIFSCSEECVTDDAEQD